MLSLAKLKSRSKPRSVTFKSLKVTTKKTNEAIRKDREVIVRKNALIQTGEIPNGDDRESRVRQQLLRQDVTLAFVAVSVLQFHI